MGEFTELSQDFFLDTEFVETFSKMNLTSIDAVFSFSSGEILTKENLARHRARIKFETQNPSATLFLKRYDNSPKLTQIKNWLSHRCRKSIMSYDLEAAENLRCRGINTPRTIAYGSQFSGLFERRSFIISEKIPNAEALERRLPNCFTQPPTPENTKSRIDFIHRLADLARTFHKTAYRHRDFYLAHIFYSDTGDFTLIDLQRVFKPVLLKERYRVKDIAQLYYSAPAEYFTKTDRLRFYRRYANCGKLGRKDKAFIRKVKAKAKRMARHDIKHGRISGFAK